VSKLEGFTLFKVSRGWQLSTREIGEYGWSVSSVSDEQAATILTAVAPLIPPALAPVAPTTNGPKDLFGKPAPARRPRVHL
jgi:hypothetical protein